MRNSYMKNRVFTSQILKAAAQDGDKYRPQHTPELNVALMEKWNRFGLLKGLKSPQQASMVAQLLENQAQWMINEADTADAEGYNTTIFPMVRRVFGGLLANDLVSVQPMSLPSGLVFYIDFVDDAGHRIMDELFYNNGFGFGTSYWLGYNDASNFNEAIKAASGTATWSLSVDGHVPSGGYGWFTGSVSNPTPLYPAGVAGQNPPATINAQGFTLDPVLYLHKYSMPEIYLADSTNVHIPGKWIRFYPVTATPDATNQVKLSVNSDGCLELTFKDATNQLFKGGLYTLDGTEYWGSYDSASSHYGANNHDATNHPMNLIVNLGHNPFEIGDSTTIGTNQPLNTYPILGEDTSNIKEVNLEVKSSPIVAATRKLRTRWTPELQQDLQAYHSIDAEQELTSIMSDSVALEIDREIIRDIIGAAGTVINLDLSGTLAGGETVQDKYRNAVEAVLAGSNAIHKRTLRGYGNWIVVSPEFATVLEFGGSFLRNDTDKTITYSSGMKLSGLLENRVKVYVDPYMPPGVAIMGYTGSSFLESGYVYAPYVPVMITPTVYDPNTFVPRKGLMTRYGKKLIRSDFFCRIDIVGWPTAGLGANLYTGGFGYAQPAFDAGRKVAWKPNTLI